MIDRKTELATGKSSTGAKIPAWSGRLTRVMAASLIALTACSSDPTVAATAAAARKPASSAQFTPTDLDMPNPERGWYAFGEDISKTSSRRVRDIYNEGFRLAFVTVNLWQYRASPLPADYLDMIKANLDVYRSAGVKVIWRVVYNYEAGSADAPLQVIMIHLNQLKPILADYADTIAYVQAGMIGAWGEWHSSTNDLTQPVAKAAVRDALMATVPPSLYVQFRYPHDVMDWLPKPLTRAQAFKDTPAARTANHNDCFMSSPNDVGTYASAPEEKAVAERAYARAATEFTPYGGETCSGFSPTRQTCADILKEGPEYHLTYLNRYFYKAFPDQWKAEGCFDQVSRQIGYRFQLDGVNHAPTVAPGGELSVDVDMRDVGWSRIFSARRLVVSLRNVETGEVIEGRGDTDLRTLPQQATASTRVNVKVKVPSKAAAGRYVVALAIPDIHPKSMGDARYAVRFANADDTAKGQAWDEDKARFSTGTSVTVQ